MKISVIIPTYNEADNIVRLLKSLHEFGGEKLEEIIVVDSPNSTDNLKELAENNGARVVNSNYHSRAAQMNLGSSFAKGKILYFVHADTQIHPHFINDISDAIRNGFDLGCYRMKFDSPFVLLKINAYFTRFNKIWCRGGDQTLFITRKKFQHLGGFREDFQIMEDFEIILRAKEKKYRFKILPKNVVVSARKYVNNSYFRVQLANLKVMRMFLSGKYSQQEMVQTYKRMLDYR